MSSSKRARLVVESLKKAYPLSTGDLIELLHGSSFTVSPGESIAIMGPNGSGKSTLLRIIAGIESPSAGSIGLEKGCEVAYLAQGIAEYSGRDLTVCEQVNLGRFGRRTEGVPIWNLSGERALHRAKSILARLGVGLENRTGDYMRHLSGGQAQAVMLSSLIGETPPDLLLLDEHSTALDMTIRSSVIRLLLQCIEQNNTSIIIVTHDRPMVKEMASRTIEIPPARVRTLEGG